MLWLCCNPPRPAGVTTLAAALSLGLVHPHTFSMGRHPRSSGPPPQLRNLGGGPCTTSSMSTGEMSPAGAGGGAGEISPIGPQNIITLRAPYPHHYTHPLTPDTRKGSPHFGGAPAGPPHLTCRPGRIVFIPFEKKSTLEPEWSRNQSGAPHMYRYMYYKVLVLPI